MKEDIKKIVSEGLESIKNDLSELSKKKKKRANAEKSNQETPAPEKKSGGLQTVQLTQQDIWDAMKGNVHKDKKKEKAKYAGRKDKHKGKNWE